MAEPQEPDRLQARLEAGRPVVAVIGLGYVGLPLAQAFTERGLAVLGVDVDESKVADLTAGRSYLKHFRDDQIARMRAQGFAATADHGRLSEADVVVICVPTPLTAHREPDLSYVEATGRAVAAALRPGQLVVLESTTYPGTTDEVLRPLLEDSGLVSGRDFWLAYAPEREDPGNADFRTDRIPKVVGADDPASLRLAAALYARVAPEIVRVSDSRTAEAVKLTENVFRAVNIALANELKQVYAAMGIDVWEVVDAAKTKPFGYMPFYPGPGLGGHCIPIDPFYLHWKARAHDAATRFIELAGEINTTMPRYVVDRLAEAVNDRLGKALNGSRVLLVGLAYKKNVGDTRESPAFRLIELAEARGARVAFHDPLIPEIPVTRDHRPLAGRRSVDLTPALLEAVDAVLICTDHDAIDYAAIARHGRLVVDTRNAMHRHGHDGPNVVKA